MYRVTSKFETKSSDNNDDNNNDNNVQNVDEATKIIQVNFYVYDLATVNFTRCYAFLRLFLILWNVLSKIGKIKFVT